MLTKQWIIIAINCFAITVKPVYNDHPRDPKLVAVVDRWSLFRGSFIIWKLKSGPRNSGCCRQVVVIRKWSLTQGWLYFVTFYTKNIIFSFFYQSWWFFVSFQFSDFNKLKGEIENRTNVLAPNKSISDHEIVLKIFSPFVFDLQVRLKVFSTS